MVDEPNPSKVDELLKPANVPAFGCIVYVSGVDGGGVRARVANLPGLEFTAESERGALSKIIPAFKAHVGELLRNGESIPWIDPPTPREANESQRFVPVHL